ncbi:COR domain-containing protein [Pseudanabaena sp. CCNP1317]|uniref:COR domain-containing protein n=1 Tax=Pseudanabaena sp. CCNP1317 TaxID=3110253 RepID=UPI002B1FF1F3|nr:COR domain-containing protein [Pseudanabaena sp. CCNP1317]MEA5486697.1 COR domain-containing protein [Pseudanabaena sp. CCNP1317]
MLPSELEEIIEQAAREEWEELNLAGKGIEVLPSTIAKCKSLKRLILINNRLSEIPDSITRLTNLQSLDLSNNRLFEIPYSITQLTNLQSLNLRNTFLSEIPYSITRLTNLQSLNLSSNILREIPVLITRLTNLQSLDLRNTRLREIPALITRLINLQSLDLSSNSLSEIPDSITRLINLQSLYLHSNSLSEIPDSITRLTNLQSLYLSSNSLREIPDSITRLTNLQSLDLRSNSLSVIPDSITRLPKLTHLALDENPIIKPPLEVVKEGLEAIRQYFKQIEVEGIDYLYEAKLLIVGEGGAGKTTLANKIINPNYQLCEEDSTKGIEVLHWSFLRTDGNQFNVNIWDFGGQEIYHSTHQYFLTKRSLYLLVADTRKEDTDFYYWLNVIELLSDNSPILIVKNENQDRQREINVNQLRGEFENLKDVFATNLANNRNLEKILTAAQHQLSQLPHIGQTLPKTWVKVRHALESDQRNHISLNEYLQICKDKGFKERKDALQLSEYLHDLGICLHFQDDQMSPLYQIVILKPKWGTDAAYAVLDNPQVIRNFGRFSNKELAQIWSADEYSGMHSGLLELMKKFQLCYEIPQAKRNYIAPQLLTENQPEYAWDESENLILRYTYDFMPKGLVRQFIVAMHESIKSQIVWRSGVIINYKNISSTLAEVTENYGKREIKIRVSGKNKRDLLTVVTHELDKIHTSYKRLANKYQKLIPCNCHTCKGSQSPHFYEFANLKRRYEKRVFTVQCEISYEPVDVLGLIDDIGARAQLQDSRTNPDLEYSTEYALKDGFKIPPIIINNNFSPTNTNHMETPPQTPNQSPKIKSAWANGSFYLFLFVVVILSIGYLAGNLPIQNLIAVIIAGIIFIPLIGTLQLRQDDRLSEKNFMDLIKLVIAQLPMVKTISRRLFRNREID